MKPRARPGCAPVGVVRCWVASVIAGGLLVALGPVPASGTEGLTPETLPTYLARAAGAGATDIRVNGVYGSGRNGAWQFVAHLTWQQPNGAIDGGIIYLPQGAGDPAAGSPFATDRLAAEEKLGWSLSDLSRATRHRAGADVAAFLELQIPRSGPSALTFCRASLASSARCEHVSRRGETRGFQATIEVTPDAGPLAVHTSPRQ